MSDGFDFWYNVIDEQYRKLRNIFKGRCLQPASFDLVLLIFRVVFVMHWFALLSNANRYMR